MAIVIDSLKDVLSSFSDTEEKYNMTHGLNIHVVDDLKISDRFLTPVDLPKDNEIFVRELHKGMTKKALVEELPEIFNPEIEKSLFTGRNLLKILSYVFFKKYPNSVILSQDLEGRIICIEVFINAKEKKATIRHCQLFDRHKKWFADDVKIFTSNIKN